MCNRLRRVNHLARKLREHQEYAAERDLLTSMQRVYERVDPPSSEMMRLASQIYHAMGDLHNFYLAEKRPCLRAYANEEEILRELSKRPENGQSLASSWFWLNRNSALAYRRDGDEPEAQRRLEAAIAIAEESPLSVGNSELIDKERDRLKQWKSETENNGR